MLARIQVGLITQRVLTVLATGTTVVLCACSTVNSRQMTRVECIVATNSAIHEAKAVIVRPVTTTAAFVSPAKFDQEKRADNRAWQVMGVMLTSFGYANKVAMFNTMWSQSTQPEQWADVRRAIEQSMYQSDPRQTALINACIAAAPGGFDHVFRIACQRADGPSSLFRGLFVWAMSVGKPCFQGRNDLALHFICGGVSEALLKNGVAMGVAKEQLDRANGKPFDLDDLSATAAGAIWVQLARDNPQWIVAWANGQHSLEDIRPLRYGQDQPFDDEKLLEICNRLRADYIGRTPTSVTTALPLAVTDGSTAPLP